MWLTYFLPDWVEVAFVGIILLLVCGALLWKVYEACRNPVGRPRPNGGFVNLQPVTRGFGVRAV
jgi:hypothetical protein